MEMRWRSIRLPAADLELDRDWRKDGNHFAATMTLAP